MIVSLAWPTCTTVDPEMMCLQLEPRVAAFAIRLDEGIGLATVTVRKTLDGIRRLALG